MMGITTGDGNKWAGKVFIDESDENEQGERTFGLPVEHGYLVLTLKRDDRIAVTLAHGHAFLREIGEAMTLVRARLSLERQRAKRYTDEGMNAVLELVRTAREQLVQPRFSWSFNHESDNELADSAELGHRYQGHRHTCGLRQGDEPACRIDHEYELEGMRPGSRVTHHAGAPGTGSVTYEITRVNEEGAWGIEVENTIRELTVEEVM